MPNASKQNSFAPTEEQRRPLIKKNRSIDKLRRPMATVDVAIFTLIDDKLHVLLGKRNQEPFNDCWALPGGIMDPDIDETIEGTAERKLREKADLGNLAPHLEQYGAIGSRTRDPRGPSITVLYYTLVPYKSIKPKAGKGTAELKWFEVIPDNEVVAPLAFDHKELLAGCLQRIRSKASYTTLPAHLMPEKFTIKELQTAFEVILGQKLPYRSFLRRMTDADLLEHKGEIYEGEAFRPSRLFSIKENHKKFVFSRTIGKTKAKS